MRTPAASRVSWPAITLTLLALGIIVATFLLAPEGGSGVPLSPRNASPDGARAVAQVLGRHGVHVAEASTLDDVRHAPHGQQATLLLTDPADVTPDDLDAIQQASPGSRIVVVAPPSEVRHRLFPGGDASEDGLVHPDGAQGGRVVINSPGVLTNRSIAQGENARLALRALGQTRELVWISDWEQRSTQAQQQGLAWPPGTGPLVWSLVLATLVLVLTRGRRFGRLAVEPLPVTVTSIESTRALATLYRRNHAREAAATALQRGTARRLAHHLALPRDAAGPPDVVAALPADQREQASCLVAPTPATDDALVDLARRLATLEKEITRE